MEYLDFCSFIDVIEKSISDVHKQSRTDLMENLFYDFLQAEGNEDFSFDSGYVSHIFNGNMKMYIDIVRYYLKSKQKECLAEDIWEFILPLMFDSSMAVQKIYDILIQDMTITDKKKGSS